MFRNSLIVLAPYLYLCFGGPTITIDAYVNGTLFAVDKNLAYQEVFFNETNYVVSQPKYLPSIPQFLPLDQFNPPLTVDSLSIYIANNAIVFVNFTDSEFRFVSTNLQCTPHALAGPTPSGILYALCLNKIFAVRPPEKPQDFPLRRVPNTNGTLLIGPAPNYALHYVTGNSAELFVKNIFDGRTSSVPVPFCSYIRNVKLVSNDHVAILCASNISTPSMITSVHFRNLTVDHYVSVNLTKPITETIIVNSLDSIVVIVAGDILHVIDRDSGNSSHFNANGHITDIKIINATLAYYITTQLTQFSPLEILKGSSPPPQVYRSGCGPPSCAFITSINEEVVIYSINNTSFVLKEKDTTTGPINLDIAPQFFVHDLVYHTTEQPAPPPKKDKNKLPLILGICSIPIIIIGLCVAIVILSIVIPVVIKKRCPSSNNSKYSVEETDRPDSSVQEQGQSVQESTVGGHRENCL